MHQVRIRVVLIFFSLIFPTALICDNFLVTNSAELHSVPINKEIKFIETQSPRKMN